ncbi:MULTISPECIES: hypothetical protein [Rhizobium]|uniref:Uncharacterized protein n=1 Tax=Rhizobium wenxiniae TaxID=1737357 RepID=A0A7W9YDZ7_9HYPH|nr:hypothetical protein [Rhizobium wenxiniae]MBB6166178.1 hypothetical protein [Rhizobium wenxiniae]
MTGQHISAKPGALKNMAALALDVGLFISEFRLCDTIAEYLADLLAQSHEDPARCANFSSLLINEIIELAFRSAIPVGRIDFNLLRNEALVRASVAFSYDRNNRAAWSSFDRSADSSGQHPAHHLMMLAQAIGVSLDIEIDGDDRVTLIADFLPREAVR